jgi:hypothetical protein
MRQQLMVNGGGSIQRLPTRHLPGNILASVEIQWRQAATISGDSFTSRDDALKQ